MKISKTTVILPVLLMIIFNLNAQVSVAPKIGLSYSKLTGDLSNLAVMPGAYFGGMINLKVHTNYSLQSGIMLSGKGTALKYSENDRDEILITYFEFPLNNVFTLEAGSGFFQIFGGPYFGMAVNAQYKYLEDENDMKEKIPIGKSVNDEIKPSDIGVTFGLGYIFEGLEFQIGYSGSLTNVSNLRQETLKNKVVTASLAYYFGYNRDY